VPPFRFIRKQVGVLAQEILHDRWEYHNRWHTPLLIVGAVARIVSAIVLQERL